MDQMPEKIDSKFRFVLLASARAEQLMRGARPHAEAGKNKPTVQAMAEMKHELVSWDYGPAPVPEEEELLVVEEPVAEEDDGGEEE